MIMCQVSVLFTLLLTINFCLTDIPPDQSDIPPGTPDPNDTPPATSDQSYKFPPASPELSDDSFDSLESDHIPEGFFDIRSLGLPLGSSIGADDYKGICLNGGTPIASDSEFVFSCKCLPGFSEQRCQTDDCRNGGKPLAYERGADGGLRCICPTGFGGDRCQAETAECHNGGKWKWNNGCAYCDCPAPFAGRRCLNDIECPAGLTVSSAEGIKPVCYKALLTIAGWSSHAKTCSSLSPNAHLAFARTKQESDRLVGFLKSVQSNSCPYIRSIFTGGQRRRDGVCTDEFVWKNGDKPVEEVTFTSWAGNQPDCSNGESCLVYQDNYTWNDVRCDWSLCGVCEVSGF